jgi:His/Glu/Gln/Arg/opine family amino acid ABC transporter permease subunit
MRRLLSWLRSERGEIALWRISVLCGLALLVRWAAAGEWGLIAPSWLFLLTALGRSWLLAVIAIGIGALAATPLALLRVYGPPGLRQAAVALIEAVRSTPELMIVFWVYFTWPLLAGSGVSAWSAAIGSLSVIATAYLAEVIRAGLYSVPAGQIEAARASGLSPFQTFRDVVLPQALRNMLPALIAQLVALFKTTSLVYAIGVMDFFRAVQVTGNAVFAPYALYMVLGAGYFFSCAGITRVVRWFDPKYQLID